MQAFRLAMIHYIYSKLLAGVCEIFVYQSFNFRSIVSRTSIEVRDCVCRKVYRST